MDAKDLTLEEKIRGIVARIVSAGGNREQARWISRGTLTHFETSSGVAFEAARQAYQLGLSEGKRSV